MIRIRNSEVVTYIIILIYISVKKRGKHSRRTQMVELKGVIFNRNNIRSSSVAAGEIRVHMVVYNRWL